MDDNPVRSFPKNSVSPGEGDVLRIDLNQPMADVCKELSKHPVATRVSLNGTIIVARDIAHAKLKERLDKGEDLPDYIKNHPVLYAGPAKTPQGMPCGSMGPTTANRMDPYVDLFQSHGGSMVMIAKGNRTADGNRCLPETRWFLPRFNRRTCCHPFAADHQEHRMR